MNIKTSQSADYLILKQHHQIAFEEGICFFTIIRMNSKVNAIETDVCIVGAGPSGAAASLMLSKLGVKHLILDKATFPRDKTCGDGLVLHVFKALKAIDPNLVNEFVTHPKFISTHHGHFHFSNQGALKIEEGQDDAHNPIFYGKRIDFDAFLVDKLTSPFVEKRFGVAIDKIVYNEDKVTLELKDGTTIHSKLVIGADGIHSVVSRQLAQNKPDPKRTSTFISAYFENITDLTPQNGAEIRMVYKKTPLFFYIFPLPNGQANVSIGGTSSELLKNKINLKNEIEAVINSHPKVANKFKTAKQVSPWRGWGIPCNYGYLTISGDRFMLTGDAAGLANSFYKEGVGTGMMSGIFSAQQAAKCLQENNFSATFMQEYDQNVKAEFGKLLKFSKLVLKFSRYPLPFKLVLTLAKTKLEKGIKGIIRRRTYT